MPISVTGELEIVVAEARSSAFPLLEGIVGCLAMVGFPQGWSVPKLMSLGLANVQRVLRDPG